MGPFSVVWRQSVQALQIERLKGKEKKIRIIAFFLWL
jgi:hypothetical protein